MDFNLRMPPELLIAIFAHLEPVDIKSARLACRNFEAASAPFLIETAYIAARVNALERFMNIASHPVFGRNVRTVIYLGSIYREELTRVETPDAESGVSLGHAGVPSTSYLRYCGLFEQQQRLMESGAILAGLTDGLQKMAKVDTILFTDSWDGNDRYGYYQSDQGDGIKPELYPARWKYASRLSDFDGFIHLLTAISVSGRQIRHLEVNCSLFAKGDAQSIPCLLFRLPPRDLQHGWQAFRGLTTITLVIGHRAFESGAGDLEGLFYMLSGAQNLRSLALETKNYPVLTQSLIRERFWPRLEHISLSFVMCESEFIKTILWNQRSTLLKFDLSYSFVFGGDDGYDESDLIRYVEENFTLEKFFLSYCDFYAIPA